MSRRGGRVVLSAWVDPVLREHARVAARSAGVEFSKWIARAVQRAVAEESAARAERLTLGAHDWVTDGMLSDERGVTFMQSRCRSCGVFVRSYTWGVTHGNGTTWLGGEPPMCASK